MNFLDIIFIVILAFFIWRGIAKGFFCTLGRLASIAIGFLAGLKFFPELGQFFYNIWHQKVNAVFQGLPFDPSVLNLATATGEELRKAENLSTLGFYLSAWTQEAAENKEQLLTSFSNFSVESVLNVLAFLVIFIVVFIVVKILIKLISLVLSGVTLGTWPLLDHTGGAILGFVRGAVLVAILVIALAYGYCFVVFDQGGIGLDFYNVFYNSQIVNYILNLLGNIHFGKYTFIISAAISQN